ncbi:biliverdin-producing heme oxygenase [Rhizobium tubonense]|uniref:Biliverdin-producing heme oxygenase n=1 Tax=Rhizobium tubonense TaxID=484088 RepID=A0A2W4DAB3_9HYPH|nr:biliverdin-producing heme oxygenase [Rhizobium tubonense]PZM13994.1 biliverdin-producing heme oxygenase [Rhizobium tubonense]
MSFRNGLRAGTGDCHSVVDRLFGGFDLADPRQYGAFLLAHARAIPAVEQALEQGGIASLLPDWADRRRSDMLAADLATLGLKAPRSLDVVAFAADDELWGAAYVLEGSKLGGAILAKRVPESLPSAYIRHQGPKGAMKAFMERLDGANIIDEDRAIAAARSIFDHFRRAAELELELFAS